MLIKEHLDENGRPDPVAQLKYCHEQGCPDCGYCLCASDMIPYIKTPTKKPIKEKVIETRLEPTKWDNLSKKATNKPTYRHEHPLYHLILELFTKGE